MVHPTSACTGPQNVLDRAPSEPVEQASSLLVGATEAEPRAAEYALAAATVETPDRVADPVLPLRARQRVGTFVFGLLPHPTDETQWGQSDNGDQYA